MNARRCVVAGIVVVGAFASLAYSMHEPASASVDGSSPPTVGQTQSVSLTSVTADELSSTDVTLAATDSQPTVSAAAADSAALSAEPQGSQVLETSMAKVSFSGGAIVSRPLWVVSVGPSGTIPIINGDSPLPVFAKWCLAFVDPDTGTVVETVMRTQ